MSVVVEFTVPTDQFAFGSALTTAERMRISLERIVPTSDSLIPFVWAAGEEFEPFERHVREDPGVEAFEPLDRLEDRVLYRIEWADPGGLIEAIETHGGAVLEAGGDPTRWYFRLRFPDQDDVSAFYDSCTDLRVELDVRGVYTPTEESDRDDLTSDQREAITMALRRGYFSTPRETTLGELADDLDISQQALSDRVRRATEKVVRRALTSSASASASPSEGERERERDATGEGV